MLPYALAIVIALSSLILFGAAFFSRDIHRKDDFLWSGVGLFYALVLWLCADGISGAVLLGQTAAALLVISFGWQTLKLRKAVAYPDKIADLESFSLLNWVQSRLSSLFSRKTPKPPKTPPATPPEESPNLTADKDNKPLEQSSLMEEEHADIILELHNTEIEEDMMGEETEIALRKTSHEEPVSPPPAPTPQISEKPAKKGLSMPKFFGLGKRKSTPKPETITQAIAEAESSTDHDEWDLSESSNEESPASSETVSTPEAEASKTEEETPSIAEVEETKTEDDSPLKVAEVNPETSPLKPLSFADDELQFEDFTYDDQAETILESSPPQLTKSPPPAKPIDSESIPTANVEGETAPVTNESEEKTDLPKSSD